MDAVIGAAVEQLGGLHFVVNTAGGGNRAVGGTPQRTLKKDGTCINRCVCAPSG